MCFVKIALSSKSKIMIMDLKEKGSGNENLRVELISNAFSASYEK